jgi:hypothetical protein
MSETRPPMTAGPIERALRFLKSTSVNCGAPEDGAGVTEADNGGVVLIGEAAGGEAALTGADAGGVSSWAKRAEVTNKSATKNRILIRWMMFIPLFAVVGQAHRLLTLNRTAGGAPALQSDLL